MKTFYFSLRPILLLAVSGALSACGLGPATGSTLNENCALPADISAPTGREISIDELIDGAQGEYRATRVQYFLEATSIIYDRHYAALTESTVAWAEDASTPNPSYVLKCQSGFDETTAHIAVPIPYSLNRESGALAQARNETFTLKGATVKSHSSEPLEGKTMSDYVYDMRTEFFARPDVRIFKQSDTKFLFVSKAEKDVLDQITLYTAITYELR